jgi:hypothetical protein
MSNGNDENDEKVTEILETTRLAMFQQLVDSFYKKSGKDEHTNADALKDMVHDHYGYTDARVLGCTELIFDNEGYEGDGPNEGDDLWDFHLETWGEMSITEEPGHWIVYVSGYILDPENGFLVIPPERASSMLSHNRQLLIEEGEDADKREFYYWRARRSDDESLDIAYVPTDPSFQP